jgi:hypothetical protein
MPVEVGAQRSTRRRQSHEAGDRAQGGAADQDRRGVRARARALGDDAAPGRPALRVLTKRTRNDPGRNRRSSNEELVVSEIGQVGTQFDTFSHQMIGTSMYNCVTLESAASRTGFTKLGVEQVGALMTRGVLIDVAALKAWPRWPRPTRSRRRTCRTRSPRRS